MAGLPEVKMGRMRTRTVRVEEHQEDFW